MAIFTNVKNNFTDFFKGLKVFGDQLMVPATPQRPEPRADSYSRAAAAPASYRDIIGGKAKAPNREVIDAILAEVLDLPPPPPPKTAVRR